MDQKSTSKRFGLIKQNIVSFKEFIKQLDSYQDTFSTRGNEFELNELLDEQGMYVKQMPIDPNMLFRAFSDSLFFSQSKFKEIKTGLCKYIRKNASQMNKLLDSFFDGDMEASDYITSIKRHSYDFEIELVLLCELYHKNAQVYYQSIDASDRV